MTTEFITTIEKEISSAYPTAEITIKPFQKNNGLTLTGLTILENGTNIAPTIYLEQFYEMYQDDASMELIIGQIISAYEENKKPQMDIDWFMDWEQVKDKVIYALISKERNEELLKDTPHADLMDLTLIFKVFVSSDGDLTTTITVKDGHMDYWGIGIEELLEAAKENTPKILPAKIEDVLEMMRSMMGDQIPEDILMEMAAQQGPVMIIVTNEHKLNGAVSILYDGLLERIANSHKANRLVIIPSSIHECLVVPVSESDDIDQFTPMIQEVNETQLEENEILSDHYYIWTRENGLTM